MAVLYWIKLWMMGHLERWPAVLGGMCFFAAMMFLFIEWTLRHERRSNRTLKFGLKNITFGTKPSEVSWRRVKIFRFQPLEGHPRERKLSMVFHAPKFKIERGWDIVIPSAEEYESLVNYLKWARSRLEGEFRIEIFHKPIPKAPIEFPPLSKFVGLSMSLIVIGLPLLFGAVQPSEKPTNRAPRTEQSAGIKRGGNFERLAVWLFKSPQRGRLILGSAGLLCLGGAVGVFVVDDRRSKKWEAEMEPVQAAHKLKHPPDEVV